MRANSRRRLAIIGGVAIVAATAAVSAQSRTVAYAPPHNVPILAPSDMITIGPHGETPAKAGSITITPAEAAQIRKGHYTAALMWDTQSTWFNSVTDGARSVFKQLGINVVSQTQYNYDLNAEKNQVDTVMNLHPNILLTIVDDPVISGRALQPMVQAGTKIVLLSTMPKGWVAGKQYVGMVTGDQAQMGKFDANELAQALGGKGDVGILYHDANYFVTNRRDRVLTTQLVRKWPNIHIVAEEGFTTPDQAEELTNAMLVQHPSIKGIYAAWDAVTISAESAIKAAGRNDIKVVSMDLGADTAKLMAQGQNIISIAVEQTHQLGVAMAKEAALAMIHKKVPAFAVVPALLVTKQTLAKDWVETLHAPLPSDVASALKG